MCVEDFRIARFVKSHSTSYTPTINTPRSFNGSMQRVGLSVSLLIGDNDIQDLTSIVFSHGARVTLNYQVPTVLLKITDWGQVIQESFTITTPTETPGIVVTEFYLPESFLAINNELLRTKYGIELGI